MTFMMMLPAIVLILEELTAPYLFYTQELMIALFFAELLIRIIGSLRRRGYQSGSSEITWVWDTIFDLIYKAMLFMLFGVA